MERSLSRENISVTAWDSGRIEMGEDPDQGTTLLELGTVFPELPLEAGWKVNVHELSRIPNKGNKVRFIMPLW